MISSMILSIRDYLLVLQQRLCDQFSEVDGHATFLQDCWERNGGDTLSGTGISCVLEGGAVFEKAGVNFSHVKGPALPPSACSERVSYANKPFEALGVSLVIHPGNPYVPTTHFNVRFFTTRNAQDEAVWWFGGGYDLTPYYGFKEDCQYWHNTAKAACEPFGKGLYVEFKRLCDEYFYLKHRHEPRGIGGIFFDDLSRWDLKQSFAFMQSVGNSFAKAYFPIVDKRKDISYGVREKTFQKIRRGRYAEFNLIYDRGTIFGLQSRGRTKSILMSLPPEASWVYDDKVEPGSAEEKLFTDFLVAKDWI